MIFLSAPLPVESGVGSKGTISTLYGGIASLPVMTIEMLPHCCGGRSKYQEKALANGITNRKRLAIVNAMVRKNRCWLG